MAMQVHLKGIREGCFDFECGYCNGFWNTSASGKMAFALIAKGEMVFGVASGAMEMLVWSCGGRG
jgi:hypothetical protein